MALSDLVLRINYLSTIYNLSSVYLHGGGFMRINSVPLGQRPGQEETRQVEAMGINYLYLELILISRQS